MLSQIVSIALTYRSAPIAVREKLACTIADIAPWRAAEGEVSLFAPETPFAAIRELVILSTCNRVELFAETTVTPEAAVAALTELLSAMSGVATAVFAPLLTIRSGEGVVEHLCHVAAGLDSQVLGEPQILGQVTAAFTAATEAKTSGALLTRAFHTAIHAGKKARTETRISVNPASISALAVARAQVALGELDARMHLIFGLGEMGHLALKALRARGLAHIGLINRTHARATQIARPGEQVYHLGELQAALTMADVVFVTTAADLPLITREMVTQVMSGKERLVLIDIAVPRNVDPAVGAIPGVVLFDADDLRGELDKARAAREEEIPRVDAIIAREMTRFRQQMRELAVKPVITDLRRKAERIRRREVARTLRHLDDLDPQTVSHIQHLSRSLINKLLHEPTLTLKAQAGEEEQETMSYAAAVRDLFGLGENGKPL